MASAEPLLVYVVAEPQHGCMARVKAWGKKGFGGCAAVAGVVFLLAVIAQACMYSMFTLGCGPKAIGSEYAFPGGGESNFGDASFNLLPEDSLLSEREPNFWGWPLDVLPANVAATAAGAQVGTWWRNNGIFFYTYTYEDIANSKMTLYMRSNFWQPWMSYKIARCDGKGPVITFSESGHWVNNKVRAWFRMNQAQSFSIWFDGEKVADAQEVQGGYPSLTITNITTGKEIASAILNNRNFHGDKDQWYAQNDKGDAMPFFVTSAISLPFAYDVADVKVKKAAANALQDDSKAQPTESPPSPTYFLSQETPTAAKLSQTPAEVATPVVEVAAAEAATPVAADPALDTVQTGEDEPQQHV